MKTSDQLHFAFLDIGDLGEVTEATRSTDHVKPEFKTPVSVPTCNHGEPSFQLAH